MWNAVANHLTPRDLQGVWRDVNGLPSGAQHFTEVSDGITALENMRKLLVQLLSSPNASPYLKILAQNFLNACNNTLDFVNNLVTGPTNPETIPDDTWNPFFQNIIASSGCADS